MGKQWEPVEEECFRTLPFRGRRGYIRTGTRDDNGRAHLYIREPHQRDISKPGCAYVELDPTIRLCHLVETPTRTWQDFAEVLRKAAYELDLEDELSRIINLAAEWEQEQASE